MLTSRTVVASRSLNGMAVRYASSSSSSPVAASKTSSQPATIQEDFEIHPLSKWAGGPISRAGPGGRSSISGVVATVFGATGFLGKYFVNRLGRIGSQILVPYRGDEHDYRHLKLMGDLGQINFAAFHLKDQASILKMVEGSNVVVNLIGQEFPTRNFTFEDAHVKGAAAIARACKEAGVPRLIHVSALNAHKESGSSWLRSKALGEEAVRSEFPEATIMRPSNVFGMEDRFYNRFASYNAIPVLGVPLQNYGENTKRPVYVVDVAKALVSAVENRFTAGQTYELVGPKEYTMEQIVQYIDEVARRPHHAFHIPTPIIKFIASIMEKTPLYRPLLSQDLVTRDATNDHVTGLPGLEDLGVQPTPVEAVGITFLRRYRRHIYFEQASSVDAKSQV